VTATLVDGELKVHYDVYDRPLALLGVVDGNAKVLYSGDGTFKK
jgi:hypothetical protein